MGDTLSLTIADGYDTGDLLTFIQNKSARSLAVAYADPAGVETQGLGEEHQLLSIVADSLIKVIGFLAGHDKIVPHASELAVLGHGAEECFRLIEHELDVKVASRIDIIDLLLKNEEGVAGDWLVCICPD